MNYKYCVSLFGIIVLATFSVLPAKDTPDFLDDIIAWADNPDIAQIIETSPITVATRSADKQGIINILNDLGVISLLQENFFLRSNKVISRNLPDYPEFFPFRHDRDKRAVYVDLFYNQTTRGFFTKGSSNICSYLATADPILRKKIATVLNNPLLRTLGNLPATQDLLAFVDLANSFTVQERRLGLMIGGKGTHEKWHINVMAPVYYLERNHYVDPLVEADMRELADNIFGPSDDPKKEKEFQDNHLISDKFGLGDTRIYVDHPLVKSRYVYLRLGALATVPTAFAFQKGLRGSSFQLATSPPQLDLLAAVDAFTQNNTQQGQDIVVPFGFAALDNLTAMLIDRPLGNGGHLGLGIYLRSRTYLSRFFEYNWARRLAYRSFLSLEYLFPATELRSYIIPVSIKEFNARNFNSEEQSESNFDFIVQQLTERIFPIALYTSVHPGFIFRNSSQMCYEGDNHGFTLGTDTYVRNKEQLKHISQLPGQNQLLDIANANAPFAYQSKMVASLFFKVHQPDKLWTLAFIGDYTFMNKGVGADFMLGFNVDVIF